MKTLFLLLFLAITSGANAQTDTSLTVGKAGKKEFLIVHFVFFPIESCGIYLFHANNETEVRPIEERTKEQREALSDFLYMKQIESNIFNELYGQGWELVP